MDVLQQEGTPSQGWRSLAGYHTENWQNKGSDGRRVRGERVEYLETCTIEQLDDQSLHLGVGKRLGRVI
jgi:hypothetical protein